MKNIYVPKLIDASIENFTSKLGIKIRKFINPVVCGIMRMATEKNSKIHVTNYPTLKKGEPYIFASTHSFPDDLVSAVVTIDRHAYFLTNSKDQVKHNPDMYAGWLNGFIFVDTKDKKSKKESLPKMQMILENGSSILIYPEASWNVTENKVVNRLFPGTVILAKRSAKEIVPLGSYQDPQTKEIYLNFGKPFDVSEYSVEEGTAVLRDNLATLRYELLEKYAPRINRHELSDNPRQDWVNYQRDKVLQFNWTTPDWEDEYLTYKDPNIIYEEDAWAFVDNLNPLEHDRGLLKIKRNRQEEDNYNVVKVLNKTWKNG